MSIRFSQIWGEIVLQIYTLKQIGLIGKTKGKT